MCSDCCICTEDTCSIRSNTTPVGRDPAAPCQSRNCEVCSVFKTQPHNFYRKSLESKNARLNQLLCSCRAVNELYRLTKFSATASVQETARRKKEVQDLLRQLVLCSENRLNCMKNIAEMAEQVPRILCVQLQSGHSQFWTEVRKVAKAINKQATQECKLAALIAIRKSIPPGNTWSQYLTSAHPKQEMDILTKWMSAATD